MLAIVRRRTVLCRGGCLGGHLELANLPFGEASVVGGALLLGLLWLGLLRGLVQRIVGGLAVGAREVDAGGGGWDLALGLEEARLQVDDVVAQLVVLGLQGLVQLAQLLKLLDLVLELLDVFLLALAEGTLQTSVGLGEGGQAAHT